jgi:hypothetical protein
MANDVEHVRCGWPARTCCAVALVRPTRSIVPFVLPHRSLVRAVPSSWLLASPPPALAASSSASTPPLAPRPSSALVCSQYFTHPRTRRRTHDPVRCEELWPVVRDLCIFGRDSPLTVHCTPCTLSVTMMLTAFGCGFCRYRRDILAKENCRGLLFSERFGGQSRTAEVAAAFPELEQSACSARPPLERVAWLRVCARLYRSKRDCVPLCISVRSPPPPPCPVSSHVQPYTAPPSPPSPTDP